MNEEGEEMNEHTMPEQKCPYCGHVTNRATAFDDKDKHRPTAGDICICIDCAQAGIITSDLTVRLPTEAEADEIAIDPVVARAQLAIRTVNALQ